MITQMIGDVVVSKLKQDYIKLENSQQYDLNIKQINPLDEDIYLDYWRGIKKIIVEGYWGTQTQGYRYAPPSVMFYKNFGLILDTDESKITTSNRPYVQDLEWEQAYMYFEASGFSGFYKDQHYTSDILAKTYDFSKFPKTKREQQLFNEKGDPKKYISPREALKILHEYPKGQPLYFNEARNTTILGSRGGGKSYFLALAEYLQQLVIDGGQYYNEGKFYDFPDYVNVLEGKQHPTVELILGSADTDKSSELFSKIVHNMNALATEPQFGCWNTPDDPDYSPCPLFKDMSGSTAPGNKKNPYIHEYRVYKNGRELKKGTGSRIYHVSYSTQKGKGKGAQAGAGGRYKRSGKEEIGLMENYTDVLSSNTSAVSRNGVQFGQQNGIGTSGNIEAIGQTKLVFLNPQDYNMLAYDDVWEGMGKNAKICFFLPFYMTLRQYKDKDGNTDYTKAFNHCYKIRAKAAESSDPSVLREEQMNRPIVPSEMWLSSKGYYLPHDEAVQREKELIKDNLYLRLGTPTRLIWDSTRPNRIRAEVDHEAEPFYTYPLPTNISSLESAILIYDDPKEGVPNDFYFLTHDPYRAENIDKGGSLGSSHMFISPKYWNDYMPPTGPLVATYTAKTEKGLKYYYEQQEKLLAYYGSPPRSLAFEANQGADCKNYYINKNKEHVLVLRPQVFDNRRIYASRVTEYGYWTTNKKDDLKRLDDFLKLEIPKLGNKKVIETLPDLLSIQQIVQHDINDNFDAVSSMALAPIHTGIQEMEMEREANTRRKNNALKFLSKNPFINENGGNSRQQRKINLRH